MFIHAREFETRKPQYTLTLSSARHISPAGDLLDFYGTRAAKGRPYHGIYNQQNMRKKGVDISPSRQEKRINRPKHKQEPAQ